MSDPRGLNWVLCHLESELKPLLRGPSQPCSSGFQGRRAGLTLPDAAPCRRFWGTALSPGGLEALSPCLPQGGFSSPKVVRAANSP